MKELNEKKIDHNQIQIQGEIKKNLALHTSVKIHRGQKVWELDLDTRKISEAEITEVAYGLSKDAAGQNMIHKKVIHKPNHLYTVAINKKNAERKFIDMLYKLYGV